MMTMPRYILCSAKHPTMKATIGQGVPACGRVKGHKGDHVGMLWNGAQVRWPQPVQVK